MGHTHFIGLQEDITWQQEAFLFFATRQGTVKKTAIAEFGNVRKGGLIAIGIEPGDTLIDVKLTSGRDQVVLITREAMSIRFSEDEYAYSSAGSAPGSGRTRCAADPGASRRRYWA